MPAERMVHIRKREDGGYDFRCENRSRHNRSAYETWFPHSGSGEISDFRVTVEEDEILVSCRQCMMIGSIKRD